MNRCSIPRPDSWFYLNLSWQEDVQALFKAYIFFPMEKFKHISIKTLRKSFKYHEYLYLLTDFKMYAVFSTQKLCS